MESTARLNKNLKAELKLKFTFAKKSVSSWANTEGAGAAGGNEIS